MAVRTGHKEELDELDKRLEELRRRFDLYFHGSAEQRRPPTANQAQLGGELRRMREEEIRTWNTVDKFRFNQIFARFVSLDRMWARTLKQIEDGVYKRDKLKVGLARQRDEQRKLAAQPEEPDQTRAVNVDLGSMDGEKQAPRGPAPSTPTAQDRARPAAAAQPPASSSAAKPAPAGGATDGNMSDQRLKQLYDVYMQARRRTGDSSALTMDALRTQIEQQIPAIRAKHNCQSVDFKVVLKDGRAMLKAVPK